MNTLHTSPQTPSQSSSQSSPRIASLTIGDVAAANSINPDLNTEFQSLTEALTKADNSIAAHATDRIDRWYPQSHIASTSGWINDPNGLCYFKGQYHVFYQLNPFGPVWDTMHWGHATSPDMIHWTRQKTAFAPSLEADREGVFSGSAVALDDELIIFYTGHRTRLLENGERVNHEVQCMAVSTDGINFTKLGTIIDCPEDAKWDFRDPKVWREGNTWRMVLGVRSAEDRGQIWMYTSPDLYTWTFERVLFEHPNPDVSMLECPDFYEVDGSWVLCYSAMGLKCKGYENLNANNAGYVIGSWTPGEVFTPESEFHLWDGGHNYYAPQSFKSPDGRRIVYGWMSPFVGPHPEQADAWCGQLTLPREVHVAADKQLLTTTPIAEVKELVDFSDSGSLLTNSLSDGADVVLDFNERIVIVEDTPSAAFIEATLDVNESSAERFGLLLHSTHDGAHVFAGFDAQTNRIVLDRSHVSQGDRGYRSVPVPASSLATGSIKLYIALDRGSIEVTVGDGTETLSSFSFASPGERAVEVVSESGTATVRNIHAHAVNSIWN